MGAFLSMQPHLHLPTKSLGVGAQYQCLGDTGDLPGLGATAEDRLTQDEGEVVGRNVETT